MTQQTYYKQFDEEYYTSNSYDDYQHQFLETARTITIPTIIKYLNPPKHWRFLDVGCSLGGNIIALNELGFSAMGTEISEYCLTASQVKEQLTFGECFNLPFEDNSFEVVICIDIFMYLSQEEILKSIKELIRVTSKYIVFSTIDKDSPNACQKHNPDHLRNEAVYLYSDQDFVDLFESAGATLMSKDLFPTSWDFAAIFKKNNDPNNSSL